MTGAAGWDHNLSRNYLQNAKSPIPEMGGTPIDRLFCRQQMVSASW